MLAAFIRVTRAVSELLQELLELSAAREALRVYEQRGRCVPNIRITPE
jgi:hypothetical protein